MAKLPVAAHFSKRRTSTRLPLTEHVPTSEGNSLNPDSSHETSARL